MMAANVRVDGKPNRDATFDLASTTQP